MNLWKEFITEKSLQNTLTSHSVYEPDSMEFIHENFLGKISDNKGLLLFKRINNTWRCCLCSNRNAFLCSHGYQIELPYLGHSEDNGPGLQFTPSPIVSKTMFTCKCVSI